MPAYYEVLIDGKFRRSFKNSDKEKAIDEALSILNSKGE